MVLSVNFDGYERLQIMSLVIFRNQDFSELVFLISMCMQSIVNMMYNSKTLLLMYWALNSDKISSSSHIAKFRTSDSDVVFLDFGDDAHDTDP